MSGFCGLGREVFSMIYMSTEPVGFGLEKEFVVPIIPFFGLR
jgi:hypothetical protein